MEKQWLTTEFTLELTGSIFPQQKSVLSENIENASLYVKTVAQNFFDVSEISYKSMTH